MKTIKQAEAEGFTIDHTAPGRPLAYKGPRFAPTKSEKLLTEFEAKLLGMLGQFLNGFGKPSAAEIREMRLTVFEYMEE